MTPLTLILRGARHYWRTHLGVVLGAALGAMVLTGALLVGVSVKATLRQQALSRVGKVMDAMFGGDRFFRAALAEEMDAAPVILLRGSVARVDGAARINQAQVLGVDDAFWQLAPGAVTANDELAINERAAAQLGVRVGETVIVRLEKPGLFSRDAPLSGSESEIISMRLRVGLVLSDAQFGRFSLQASQLAAFSVFIPRTLLARQLGLADRANLLLLPVHPTLAPADAARFYNIVSVLDGLRGIVRERWELADASLELRAPPGGEVELRTPRVFLDSSVVAAAPPGAQALTYLVNELRAGGRATPYSMVTATNGAAEFLPANLADGEIVISQWLADDLAIGAGGEVTLKYFVMGERRQLLEKERTFTVRAVIPMTEPHWDRSWMPDFPGLTDKQNCREWEPGFEFDATRMREQDQAYWEQYRGTPKAFVNLKVGQEMWGNRWGRVTSIRWPAGTDQAEIARELLQKLTPEQVGFQFIPLRAQALAATDAPVDFGELFLSFSAFLISAAAVLTGMLFVFSLEQRSAEAGLLLALGLPAKQVRWLFLAEGAVLAMIGSGLGAAGGVLYAKVVLKMLGSAWRGAVGAVDFVFVLPVATLLIGSGSGVVVALLAMWLASRRQLRHSARELLVGETESEPTRVSPAGRRRQHSGRVLHPAAALACLLAAGGLLLFGGKSPGAFFGAGASLLMSGILFCLWQLRRLAETTTPGLESITQLGLRNAARRRGRSLATIAVLAAGVFMVVAVDSFRHRPLAEGDPRDPGTGGFALVGESALPIYEDLNTAQGREAYGLSDEMMRGVQVVPLRVREGDDASCLNLHRALQPRLLGVDPAEFAARDNVGLFHLSWMTAVPHGWRGALAPHAPLADGAVPGIVDANTLQWALQKKVWDTIEYRDERGQPFAVRIVGTVSGSILQGAVLIAESRFLEKFPGTGGARAFLIDCPPPRVEAVRAELSRALTDRGLELTATARRLGEFQAVENTYLAIFQALGGLGLLLGSAGLAIVVARNVLERRAEFGALEAMGFRPRQLRALVNAEHRWLIAAALGIGCASAFLAVAPNLFSRAGGFPWRSLGGLTALLAAGCLFWMALATRLALSGSRISALRSE